MPLSFQDFGFTCFSDFSCEMTLLILTVLLTTFVSQTLPKDSSVLPDRQRVTSAGDQGVTWVLQGSEVSLRCQVNTSGCGQYHNVKGRFKTLVNKEKFFYFFNFVLRQTLIMKVFSMNSLKLTSKEFPIFLNLRDLSGIETMSGWGCTVRPSTGTGSRAPWPS